MAKFIIRPDGTVTGIYADKFAPVLRSLGEVKVRRASHVEPTEDGQGWAADMSPVGGPMLGPFPLREEALAAEVAWLNEHLSEVVV